MINLLVQYAVARHPELPDVPAVVDLAENEEQRQILGLFASGSDIGRSIVAPPGVAQETVAGLRAAFVETVGDPALIEEARMTGMDLDPLDGKRLQGIVAQAVDVTPQIVDQAKKFSAPAR
jgi:tripartite-type tricarboxylate transporter receptor subunit TctC